MIDIEISKNGIPHINTEQYLIILTEEHIIVRDKEKGYSSVVTTEGQVKQALVKCCKIEAREKELIKLSGKILGGKVIWQDNAFVPKVKLPASPSL